MADARLDIDWEMTAAIVAKIHNANCAKRSDMILNPSALNPMRAREHRNRQRVSIATAREFFTGRKTKE